MYVVARNLVVEPVSWSDNFLIHFGLIFSCLNPPSLELRVVGNLSCSSTDLFSSVFLQFLVNSGPDFAEAPVEEYNTALLQTLGSLTPGHVCPVSTKRCKLWFDHSLYTIHRAGHRLEHCWWQAGLWSDKTETDEHYTTYQAEISHKMFEFLSRAISSVAN